MLSDKSTSVPMPTLVGGMYETYNVSSGMIFAQHTSNSWHEKVWWSFTIILGCLWNGQGTKFRLARMTQMSIHTWSMWEIAWAGSYFTFFCLSPLVVSTERWYHWHVQFIKNCHTRTRHFSWSTTILNVLVCTSWGTKDCGAIIYQSLQITHLHSNLSCKNNENKQW